MDHEAMNGATQAGASLSQSESDMLRIWRQILKVEDLNVDSNFFDLGGHSLLLARLQIVIKREFGLRLTTAEVFRHPTVGTLAAWLEQAQAGSKQATDPPRDHEPEHDPRIVPIQPLGAGRPLFVISQSTIFRTFAAELGTDLPVYAIQILDQDAAAMASAGFAQLVDYYVRLIRKVQPCGPYRLAGWCHSGWVAYGVARQMEQQGEKIEMAMIVDARAPAYWSNQPPILRTLLLAMYGLQRLRWIARRQRHHGQSQFGSYIWRCRQAFANAAKRLSARIWRARSPMDMRQREEEKRARQLEITARVASKAGPLLGKALFFRSEGEPTGPLLAADMGWSELVGRPVNVEILPGDHREIFNLPGVRIMADSTRELLGLPATPRPDK